MSKELQRVRAGTVNLADVEAANTSRPGLLKAFHRIFVGMTILRNVEQSLILSLARYLIAIGRILQSQG